MQIILFTFIVSGLYIKETTNLGSNSALSGENEHVFRSRNCLWSEHFCVLSLSSV